MSPGFACADVEEAEVGREAGRAEDVQRRLRRRQRRIELAERTAAGDRVVLPAELPDDGSPGAKRGSWLSTTSPTACPVIGSPTSVGFAYERAVLIRPRMYGSSESHCEWTSTSPGPAEGTSDSTSAKSLCFGKPSGPSGKRDLPVHHPADPLTASRSGEAAHLQGSCASQDLLLQILRPAPNNGASRARTGDLLAASQTLSQLSYGPWVSRDCS